jgi:oligoribonuclease
MNTPVTQNPAHLVWMDLEMTGLDPDVDTILEMAILITDADLNIVAEGPSIAIHQDEAVLSEMNDWCKTHHGASGLTARVQKSTITMADAEAIALDFVRQYVPERGSPLCGNSIHQDRRFLVRYMPRLEAYMHYRNIDVSTIKELARRWYAGITPPPKRAAHLALDDIHESIAELAYYRKTVFVDALSG